LNGEQSIVCFGGVPVNPGGGVLADVFVAEDETFPVIEHLYKQIGSNVSLITSLLKLNGIVYGGIVSWKEGLTFYVTPTIGYINGYDYPVPTTSTVTLDPADPDLPRIDLIVLNTSCQITFIKGIPAEQPFEPTPDPTKELAITPVLIPAGATSPGGVSGIIVYNEHAVGEFTPSASGVVADFDYTGITAYNGQKTINVGTLTTGDNLLFQQAAPVNISDCSNLSLAIKLKTPALKEYQLFAQLKLNGIIISREIRIPFNGNDTSNWQLTGFDFTAQAFAGTAFNQILLVWRKSGTQTEYPGFYLDYIRLTSGVQSPATDNSIILEGDVIGNGQTGVPVRTTLATVNNTPGTFGTSTKSPRITVDQKGRVTGVQEVEISGILSFHFSQGTPAIQWIINHSLGKVPAVTVTDSSGTEIDCEVVHSDLNTTVLYFF